MTELGLSLIPIRPIRELIDLTVQAEKLGYDYMWIADTYWSYNTYAVLSALALKTKTIKLGPTVSNPYSVNPAHLAGSIAAVDNLSQGRAIMAIGIGDLTALNQMGEQRPRPLTALRESIAIMRKLLNGEPVIYPGKVFNFSQAKLKIEPSANIPFHIGGRGPQMLKLATQIADGVQIGLSNPDELRRCVDQIKAGLKEAKRPSNEFHIAPYAMISLSDDYDQAREDSMLLVPYMATNLHPDIIKRHHLTDSIEKIRTLLLRETEISKKEMMEVVDDEVIDALVIAGDMDFCKQKIREITKLDISQLMVVPINNPKPIIEAGPELMDGKD